MRSEASRLGDEGNVFSNQENDLQKIKKVMKNKINMMLAGASLLGATVAEAVHICAMHKGSVICYEYDGTCEEARGDAASDVQIFSCRFAPDGTPNGVSVGRLQEALREANAQKGQNYNILVNGKVTKVRSQLDESEFMKTMSFYNVKTIKPKQKKMNPMASLVKMEAMIEPPIVACHAAKLGQSFSGIDSEDKKPFTISAAGSDLYFTYKQSGSDQGHVLEIYRPATNDVPGQLEPRPFLVMKNEGGRLKVDAEKLPSGVYFWKITFKGTKGSINQTAVQTLIVLDEGEDVAARRPHYIRRSPRQARRNVCRRRPNR